MCAASLARGALYYVVTAPPSPPPSPPSSPPPRLSRACRIRARVYACTYSARARVTRASAFPAGVTGGVYCEGGLAPLMALACSLYCRSDGSLPTASAAPKAKERLRARARSPITSEPHAHTRLGAAALARTCVRASRRLHRDYGKSSRCPTARGDVSSLTSHSVRVRNEPSVIAILMKPTRTSA